MSRSHASRPAATPARRRASRPVVEGLEDRLLLFATSGGAWSKPIMITYSFAPDGTDVFSTRSTLNQTLANQGVSQATWQAAFQKAAAYWQAAANINLVQVADDGTSFGDVGNQQGDSRFGDIRIGGGSWLGSGTLAACFLPPPINGDSLAGDIVVNTNMNWGAGGYDLPTVAIHEFGHALGLDHSTLTSADMYWAYNYAKQTMTSDDIAGIQAVYGTRQPDAFDAAAPNNSILNPTDITSYVNNPQAQATFANLDITNTGDVDFFKVLAPSNTSGTLTVTMQSSGLSSLSPKLFLYVYNNGTLTTAMQTGVTTFGGTVSLTVTGVSPGQQFVINTRQASSGAGSVGAYGLLVNFGTGAMAPIPSPNTAVAAQPNQGGGSSGLSAGGDGEGQEFLQIGDRSSAVDYLRVGDLPGAPGGLTFASAPAGSPSLHALDGLLAAWEPDDSTWVFGRRHGGH